MTELVTAREAPSFQDTFRSHFDYVVRSLVRLGVPERDVEDAAQDLFLTVHRVLHTFDPTRPIKPWLFGIAVRVASDYRKRSFTRHEKLETPPDVPDGDPVPERRLETKSELEKVLRALGAVQEDRRPVLIMHDIEGHTMPEITDALAINLNTAYSRLRLAREDFEAAVARENARRHK